MGFNALLCGGMSLYSAEKGRIFFAMLMGFVSLLTALASGVVYGRDVAAPSLLRQRTNSSKARDAI
jgi:hypothetical protein